MRTTVAHQYHVFDTVGGFCGIAWNTVGITRFQLPAENAATTERSLLRRIPGAEAATPPNSVLDTVTAVKRYFTGHRTDFSNLELDLAGQAEFVMRIYAAARRIGWGQTSTYGTLAKEVGAGPDVARAVGQAMANNPIPLIIPCHRVLAAGGKVGGFSAPGGAASKIKMLELEGMQFEPKPPTQQSLAL